MNDLDQICYYYMRTQENKPVATVCIVQKDRAFAKGVAVCSLKENFSKMEGRNKARKRAMKALFTRENSENLNRPEVFEALWNVKDYDFSGIKSEFMPSLSTFEKKLLGLVPRKK